MEVLAGGYAIVVLLVVLIAILWIILPFAIFGTKPILRELLAEQRRTNELLAGLERRQASAAAQTAPTDRVRT